MCTAITCVMGSHYFGRTMDYEVSFGEQVVITPRRFPLIFLKMPAVKQHYAIIGMAKVVDGYPLYFDGMNEAGLCMAGLNFPGYAAYQPQTDRMDNITPFELIPWVLSQCKNIVEVKTQLDNVNLANIPFSDTLPLSPLHWMVSDGRDSIVIEPMKEGLCIFDNPIGVMTNTPPFDYHMLRLSEYANLSNQQPARPTLPLYSRGMGAIGLPGDFSSSSRFVRAAFVKTHSVAGETENERINQLFHLLDTVSVPRGAVLLEDGQYVITRYTAVCDAAQGSYHYITYDDLQRKTICMYDADLDGESLIMDMG